MLLTEGTYLPVTGHICALAGAIVAVVTARRTRADQPVSDQSESAR